MKKIIICLIFTFLMSCGLTNKDLGLEKASPDEMLVVSREPLSIPPEFGLRPLIVSGDSSDVSENLSVGEKALLSQM